MATPANAITKQLAKLEDSDQQDLQQGAVSAMAAPVGLEDSHACEAPDLADDMDKSGLDGPRETDKAVSDPPQEVSSEIGGEPSQGEPKTISSEVGGNQDTPATTESHGDEIERIEPSHEPVHVDPMDCMDDFDLETYLGVSKLIWVMVCYFILNCLFWNPYFISCYQFIETEAEANAMAEEPALADPYLYGLGPDSAFEGETLGVWYHSGVTRMPEGCYQVWRTNPKPFSSTTYGSKLGTPKSGRIGFLVIS